MTLKCKLKCQLLNRFLPASRGAVLHIEQANCVPALLAELEKHRIGYINETSYISPICKGVVSIDPNIV